MAGKIKNLIGNQYGFLEVVGLAPNGKLPGAYWFCKCSCGSIIPVRANSLKSGYNKSCGCKTKEMISKTSKRHGKIKHDLYYVWAGMKKRCENPNHEYYSRYGGRGITICERWQNIDNFIEDMNPRPSPKYTIERMDNNKGYSLENCRWATKLEQCSNKSNNRYIEYNNEKLTISQWARKLGINKGTLRDRLDSGWAVEDVLFKEVREY